LQIRFERAFIRHSCYSRCLSAKIRLQIPSFLSRNLIAIDSAFAWLTKFAASDVGAGFGRTVSGVRQDFAQAADKGRIAQCQSDNRGTAYAAGS
jgi:hypothetical protein